MAFFSPLSLALLLRRRFSSSSSSHFLKPTSLSLTLRTVSTSPSQSPDSTAPPNPTSSLSSRLAFVFDQLDAIERDREARDAALNRIRQWRHQSQPEPQNPAREDSASGLVSTSAPESSAALEKETMREVLNKEVELVHPWPEWIELMGRLASQNYFHLSRRANGDLDEEGRVAENAGIDISGIEDETTGFDFSRDWTTVRNACMNFGRDRFDILRSLSRKDLQILVGYGCPNMDPKVVFSAKLLRKYAHIDEGDVCSSCSLRSTCGRGYILTKKEDEARTLDVMRILLTFGFDHVNGSVENKPLTKNKSVKTVVRKLLHEVVKLSAVPIDPNLPPPVIKKPPPKVKQPPPPPKKRVGRDDVEMKKGDWLCPKCDFMNFAKNTVCMQCDAKRPKRQLLPGEWECPQCNFLNYRRNMACFHCEHKRPPDEFVEDQIQPKQFGGWTRLERATKLNGVSDAWNFDFDDNESDGADVAAFEFADHPKSGNDAVFDGLPRGGTERGFIHEAPEPSNMQRTRGRGRYFSDPDESRDAVYSSRTGFDDFDDEEDGVDSYELDKSNDLSPEVSRKNFSDVEKYSGSEDSDEFDGFSNSKRRAKDYLSGSEDEGHYSESDNDLADNPRWKSGRNANSRQNAGGRGGSHRHGGKPFGSDDDVALNSDFDNDMDEDLGSRNGSRQQGSSSRVMRRGKHSNSDGGLPFDSDSNDDEVLGSSKNRMRGDRGALDRRLNTRQVRPDDRMDNRRNSFSSDRSERRSRRDDGGWRDNERFRGFNRLSDDEGSGNRSRERSNRFNDISRGSRGDGCGGRRGDDGFRHFDQGGNRGTFKRQRGRTNRFTYPSSTDDGFRHSDKGGSRGTFNRQRGRANRFTDRSSTSSDERPRRRIIER